MGGSRLVFGDGFAGFLGKLTDTTPHRHYAIQLCIALDGTCGVGDGQRYRAVLIPSGVEHQLHPGDATLMLWYYEPTGRFGAALRTRYRDISDVFGPLAEVQSQVASAVAAGAGVDLLHDVQASIETALVPSLPAAVPEDPRIAAMAETLSRLGDEAPSVAELASDAGLSASRARHLFRDQLGISIRSYRLWARMRRVVQLVAEGSGGATLTETAHAVGFADSAHLSRSFRKLFGVTPSELVESQRQGL